MHASALNAFPNKQTKKTQECYKANLITEQRSAIVLSNEHVSLML